MIFLVVSFCISCVFNKSTNEGSSIFGKWEKTRYINDSIGYLHSYLNFNEDMNCDVGNYFDENENFEFSKVDLISDLPFVLENDSVVNIEYSNLDKRSSESFSAALLIFSNGRLKSCNDTANLNCEYFERLK